MKKLLIILLPVLVYGYEASLSPVNMRGLHVSYHGRAIYLSKRASEANAF